MKKLIPDCFWPEVNNGAYVSHEAVCVLNPYEEEITLELTLYFEDREKISGIKIAVPAERTNHIRLDKVLADILPKGVPYAMAIECDKEVPVQYTRVDTTQAELSISTTII